MKSPGSPHNTIYFLPLTRLAFVGLIEVDGRHVPCTVPRFPQGDADHSVLHFLEEAIAAPSLAWHGYTRRPREVILYDASYAIAVVGGNVPLHVGARPKGVVEHVPARERSLGEPAIG